MQEMRDAEAKAARGAKRGGLGDQVRDWVTGRKGGSETGGKAEDLVQCPKCGAYVAARGAGPCGRGDCPH